MARPTADPVKYQLELDRASERMREILFDQGINEKELANRIGKKDANSIRNIVIKRYKISTYIAGSICTIFPQYFYKWVYTGDGPKYRPGWEKTDEILQKECKNCTLLKEKDQIIRELKLLMDEYKKNKERKERHILRVEEFLKKKP